MQTHLYPTQHQCLPQAVTIKDTVFLETSNNEPVCGHMHHNANKGLRLEAYWAAGAPLLEVGSAFLIC